MGDESNDDDESVPLEHFARDGDPETQRIRTHFWLECMYRDKHGEEHGQDKSLICCGSWVVEHY